jgi:glycosyltransferase involved in cell wall biosynthesis
MTGGMPAVSVVTRTKNRPLLLQRALDSVGQQRFTDWEHLIVNDGGDPSPVDRLAAGEPRRRTIHNPRSYGMEAASNVALRQARGRYVVVHDDDDSWDPAFLEATVALLDQAAPSVGGVITGTVKVRERIEGDRVIRIDETPINEWLEQVTLRRVAVDNPFQTIAFLYRRAILDQIGYYREDLPVAGDWEFNLRFCRLYEIAVIRRPLARYHLREGVNTVNSNSVLTGELAHWEARLRNKLLRRDLAAGQPGLGFMVNVSPVLDQLLGRRETALDYFRDKVRHLGARLGLSRFAARSDS